MHGKFKKIILAVIVLTTLFWTISGVLVFTRYSVFRKQQREYLVEYQDRYLRVDRAIGGYNERVSAIYDEYVEGVGRRTDDALHELARIRAYVSAFELAFEEFLTEIQGGDN